MYFMSNVFLKDNIDGVCVLKFKISYIHNTTHPSHNNQVKLCRKVHSMWWGSKDLELQKWDD